MIGGLSLIFFPLFFLFVPQNQDIYRISIIMFYLSFAVNYPHFLISYQFLYVDNFKRITENWRLFLSGIIVPAVLVIYIIFSVSQSSSALLGYMLNAMFFFVGHHYIKQIIGCIVVTSALKGVYFNKWERSILAINMFAMWMISFSNGNLGTRTLEMHGIKYQTFNLPRLSLYICYSFIFLSLTAFIWQILRKFIQTGKWVPFNALVAFTSIYAWYIPVFYHPSYFYMIPFFHSLQYLLFAFAYVKNRYRPDSPDHDPVKYRKKWIEGATTYISISVILGVIFFETIPKSLDRVVSYNNAIFGPELFMFIFVIFINIHHYFIDFAIWRRDNENVRKYLFH